MVEYFSFYKITALALADAVNPCALAVLALVLLVLLTQDPKNPKRVLYGGLAFTSAVYLGYFIYGFVITNLFKFLLQSSTGHVYLIISKTIYYSLATIAMIIGALQVKDYFMYKKGSFGTEMPLFMRPKMKKWVKKITSPGSAFTIGIFVTLFLLPCTIGPLIVASGLLSELPIITIVSWLLYYDVVFVLPMLVITFLIFFGIAKVDQVDGWKERNIRRLHLIAGILMFLVGLAILLGII